MFSGVDDDDLDFNPAAGSKLASLFGLERSPEKGNASLTYTAPKQPKHHSNDDSASSKKTTPAGNPSTSAPSNKLSLISVKAVTSFKLEDGNYNPQGKLGLALLGNSTSRLFQLLLYKGKQQQITSVRISVQFQFTVQPHLYASFYDDRTQNWSIMFESKDDAIEFATQVAVARFRSAALGEDVILSQEVIPGIGDSFKEGETVDLKLSAQPIPVDSVQAVNIRQYTIQCSLSHQLAASGWATGLVGAACGAVRVIIIPVNTSVPWLTSKRNEPLLVEACINRLKNPKDECAQDPILNEPWKSKTETLASGVNSATDSGAEDASIRARGASIKEALSSSPRSHKASIISRMARMGQATLPLKGAIVCNPSDSEETEEDLGTNGTTKPPLKSRPAKTRTGPGPSALRQQPAPPSAPVQSSMAPTSVSSVPAPVVWNQQHNVVRTGPDGAMFQVVSPEGQLVSLSSQQHLPYVATTTAVMSPSDPSPHMSMFLSEARMQNTEIRMHLSKFHDKVDHLLTKVDTLQLSSGSAPATPASSGIGLEPNVLLSSIEKLVKDNQSLQAEVAEKNKRLDEQNERIFSLLNTNSKFLEQSSSLLEQKQLQEQKQLDQRQQQNDYEEQSQLLQQVREEKVSLGNQLASLQNQLATVQELVQALQKSNTELNQELETVRGRLQEKDKCLREIELNKPKSETEGQLLHLNQTLEILKSNNMQLQEQVAQEQSKLVSEKEIADEKCRKLQEQHKTELTEAKGQISVQAEHYAKVIQILEKKCEELSEKLQAQSNQSGTHPSFLSEHLIADVKILMNTLHKSLTQQFIQGQSYDGADIKIIISSLVKREALQFVGKLEIELSSSKLKNDLERDSSKPEPVLPSSETFKNEALNFEVKADREQSFSSLKDTPQKFSDTPNNQSGASTAISINDDEAHKQCADIKKNQDPSFETSWRPQPPPPPIFQEDEDSDDWLT